MRLIGVSELADPTRLIGCSVLYDPALVPKCDEVSSESEFFIDSTETVLPIPKDADSALSVTSDPLSGFRVMVMLSGPLESELARMNIFWWDAGGEMATGEVCWGGWGERVTRGGFWGMPS